MGSAGLPDMISVLIVDDEASVVGALRRLMQRNGFEVRTTTSPREALDLIASHPPDVVIADFKMPEMNGACFLEEVAIRVPSAVRILVSGQIDLDGSHTSLDGVHILAKPWDNKKLVQACNSKND
jgi:DNA-binding NtrC family response regulator